MLLEADELVALTRKRRPTAQARALRAMGVEHRTRADGSLVVSRAHVEALLGGQRTRRSSAREKEPDFSAI
jgi:hypothetical protein